jgi:mannose-6-phosphate isomerase-like protein (cupin superfamily)
MQGALQFRIAGEDRLVSAGEEVAVPRGALHSAYNPGGSQALVIWETAAPARD